MKKTIFLEDENAVWLKGNLHSHSTNSDGKLTPDALIKGYRDRGYDFYSITEHDKLIDYTALAGNSILMIPGMELSTALSGRKVKDGHFGFIQKRKNGSMPQGELFDIRTKEELLDFIEKYHEDYLIILNHPYWSLLEWEEVIELPHISCMEIYNHSAEWTAKTGEASDFWNTLLRKGKKLWGIAADDNHNKKSSTEESPFGSVRCDSFGGWIQVKAKEKTIESVIEAIEAGSFYATTGPEIYDFYVEDDMFYVKCSPCQRILISGDMRCYQISYGDGITEFSGKVKGKEQFIRVQCIDENGKMASSNPIYLK